MLRGVCVFGEPQCALQVRRMIEEMDDSDQTECWRDGPWNILLWLDPLECLVASTYHGYRFSPSPASTGARKTQVCEALRQQAANAFSLFIQYPKLARAWLNDMCNLAVNPRSQPSLFFLYKMPRNRQNQGSQPTFSDVQTTSQPVSLTQVCLD